MKYIDYDSLYKPWQFALICKFSFISKTDWKINHSFMVPSFDHFSLANTLVLAERSKTKNDNNNKKNPVALISVVLLFVCLFGCSFIRLLWWSDFLPII